MSKLDLSGKYLHRRTKKVFFVDTDKVLEGDADFKNRTLFEKIFNPVDGYVIISPSLYWVKKEKIALKSLKKAERLAPAIFNGILPQGEYEYAAFNGGADDEIVFAAYDKNLIEQRLKSDTRLSRRLHKTKVFFAQSEFAAFDQDVALDGEHTLSFVDGVAVKIPSAYCDSKPVFWKDAAKRLKPGFGGISFGDSRKFELKTPKIDLAASVVSLLLIVLISLYGVDSFKSYKELKNIQDEKELIAVEYNVPPDKATMDVEKKRYEAVEKKQLSVRRELKIFNSLPLVGGESVEKISYENGRLALSIKTKRGAELKKYLESNGKLEGFVSNGESVECRILAE